MLEEIQKDINQFYSIVGYHPTTIHIAPDLLAALRDELRAAHVMPNGMTVLGLALVAGAPRGTFYVS